MAIASIKKVNAELRKDGIPVELVKGHGYFYFAALKDAAFGIEYSILSVYVTRVTDLSLEQWRDHARDGYKKWAMENAFELGQQAREAGKGSEANPFQTNHSKNAAFAYQQWIEGWAGGAFPIAASLPDIPSDTDILVSNAIQKTSQLAQKNAEKWLLAKTESDREDTKAELRRLAELLTGQIDLL